MYRIEWTFTYNQQTIQTIRRVAMHCLNKGGELCLIEIRQEPHLITRTCLNKKLNIIKTKNM